jgi:hypothetical protein
MIAFIIEMETKFKDKDDKPVKVSVDVNNGPPISPDTGLSHKEKKHIEKLVMQWNEDLTTDEFWNDLITWLDRWNISLSAQVMVMDTIKRLCKTGTQLEWAEEEKEALVSSIVSSYAGFQSPSGQSKSHIIYQKIRDYRTSEGVQLSRIVGADVAELSLAAIRTNLAMSSS